MGGSSSLPERIGDYRVLGHLGEGGMGSVLKAVAPDGRTVAVKVVRVEYASLPAFRARFRREAEAAARVPRFCTAEVLDFDVDGDEPYIVTEYIDGPTLHRSVHEHGPWQAADLEQLGVSVAAALTAIHDAGVVHRDLKPGNVLLSRSGPRVIDFGIARALDATAALTATGQPIGTPAYMAPEQYQGAEATPAVDVFAWGGLMVFAATARSPFGDGPAAATAYRVVHEDPDLDGLDPRLQHAVTAAMAKDPSARPDARNLLTLLGVRDPTTDPLRAAGRQLAGWVPPAAGSTTTAPAPLQPPAAARLAAAHRGSNRHRPAAAADPAVAATAVQTPPPLQTAKLPALDLDLADPDGPATAEMPPVQVLEGPRPVNRPGAGRPLPPTPTPTPTPTPAPTPPPAADAPPQRPPRGRRLVAGALLALVILTVAVVSRLRAGGQDDQPPAGQAATATVERFGLAIDDPVTIDQPAPGAGELAVAGEREVYAFEGIKGQKLYLTAPSCEATGGAAAFDVTWSLTDPSGQRVGLGSLCADPSRDPELPTLPASGRYQLTFKADGSATGRFSFLLSAPPEAPGDQDGGIMPADQQPAATTSTAAFGAAPAPAGTDSSAPAAPAFRGQVGHYERSVAFLEFLDDHEGQRVYLDVTMSDSEVGIVPEGDTTGATFFALYDASCTPGPAGQPPAVDDCPSGTATNSVTIDSTPSDSQLSYASGTWHLKGYFAVQGVVGARMGEVARAIVPVPLARAVG